MSIERKSFLIEAFHSGSKPLRESSLSSIIKHIEDPTSVFAQISASRKKYSKRENEERHTQLKNDVRKLGFGFIEMAGGFEEEDGTVQEKSLFIPIKTKDLHQPAQRPLISGLINLKAHTDLGISFSTITEGLVRLRHQMHVQKQE